MLLKTGSRCPRGFILRRNPLMSNMYISPMLRSHCISSKSMETLFAFGGELSITTNGAEKEPVAPAVFTHERTYQ
jgi:hypothetical protein